MNPADETAIREQLDSALSVINSVAPPLDAVLSRATRRKRTRRIAGGFMAVAATGAAVAIVATVVSAAPTHDATVKVGAAPSHASLVAFAKAHGAKKIAGPFRGTSGSYGTFTTKRAIVVAHYDGTQWQQDGAPVTKLGPGRFVMKLSKGPQLGNNVSSPSFAVRVVGGDVSYFGSVLYRDANGWRPANFGTCGHHKLCYSPSNSEPYGHVKGGQFVSINNDCTPNCAAGTEFHVFWKWNAAKAEFVAGHEVAHGG